jgi:N-acetylmuramoyl-L-alanine amidase
MIRKILLICVIFQGLFGWAQATKFKVILDAGHGGKDFGAVYHGSIEKNIALKTALKVGEILEKDPTLKNYPELKERLKQFQTRIHFE